jgi:hypothetical protein
MNKLITKAPPNTKFSPVDRIFRIASGLYNGISTHAEIESAAHTAVSTGRLYLPGGIVDFLGYQGRYRTTLNAFPARDTDRFLEKFVTKGANLNIITPICHINGANTHNLAAGPNTYAALDALVGIEIKKRIAGVNREVLGHTTQTLEPLLVKTNAVDQVLEPACATLPAQETVEVMIAKDEFKGHTANPLDLRVIRNNRHPLINRGTAGWMEFFLFFNLN